MTTICNCLHAWKWREMIYHSITMTQRLGQWRTCHRAYQGPWWIQWRDSYADGIQDSGSHSHGSWLGGSRVQGILREEREGGSMCTSTSHTSYTIYEWPVHVEWSHFNIFPVSWKEILQSPGINDIIDTRRKPFENCICEAVIQYVHLGQNLTVYTDRLIYEMLTRLVPSTYLPVLT